MTPVTKKRSTTTQVKYTPSPPMSAAASVFQVREGNRQTGATSRLQIMYRDVMDRDPFCVLFLLFLFPPPFLFPSLCHLFLLP